MKFLQETTEWRVPTPNHVYIFDGSSTKIVGYIKEGTTKAIKLPKPMGFDKRRRTFEEMSSKGFDMSEFKKV